MDSTVIQEIANQLGMAVDQAGQFITEHLPEFAELKVIQNVVPLVIAWIPVLICLIVGGIAIVAYKSELKKRKEKDSYRTDWDDFASFWVFIWSMVISGVFFVIAIVVTAYAVPVIIGWSNYPEAMLIDMALKAVW